MAAADVVVVIDVVDDVGLFTSRSQYVFCFVWKRNGIPPGGDEANNDHLCCFFQDFYPAYVCAGTSGL